MSKWLRYLVYALVVFWMAGAAYQPEYTKSDYDYDTFSYLPVVHSGRVKPIDSLARHSLLVLRGKQRIKTDDEHIKPVPWLLTVLTDSKKADAYPVFRVDHPQVIATFHKTHKDGKYFSFNDIKSQFELINSQADAANETQAQFRNSYQRAIIQLSNKLNTYIALKHGVMIEGDRSLRTLMTEFEPLYNSTKDVFQNPSDDKMRQANPSIVRQILSSLNQFRFLSEMATFFPIVGDNRDGSDWKSVGGSLLSVVREGSFNPQLWGYARVFDAYQTQNEAGFNKAVTRLHTKYQEAHPEILSKVKKEVIFNRMAPFYQSMVLYLLVFFIVGIAWLRDSKSLIALGFGLVLLAFIEHSGGLFVRMLLQGRPPVTNLYSSAVFVGWVAILLAVILERIYKNGVGSMVSAITGFVTLIIAHHLSLQGDTLEMMQAVLDSNFWLATHVIAVNIGYGGTILMGAIAHIYIFKMLFAKSFDDTDKRRLYGMVFGMACIGLLFTFIGTILGGIWADQSWGRFWGWDPKENGALLIILWLAIMLHARLGGVVQARGFMAMAVFANVVTAFSWFGVNMLGVGLHSYGFMERGFFWLVLFSLVEAVVIWFAFYPGRSRIIH